jgi:serine/threonine-protein kinase
LADADLAPFLRKALTETSREPTTVSSPALTGPPEERAGDLIGPYRLVRELGKGGMGTVWLAERSDGSFQRKVALKLPRSEWVDRGLAQRFARERAVLATLDHPHIAQMLDAGQTPSGRPYLALEYVEGVPIDAWCEEQKLGVVATLRLFVEVIRAVAHAHARLVVHRDLKPSNVLVTADGRSKLLDFGIAKLLTADTASAEETELTRLAGRALTPSYAAPEQILGQPVSTATDIYALGVMLYELLTGARPYGFGRTEPVSRAALEDRIVTADVRAPSDAAADPSTKRVLRGDLDAIVLKTLKKKPAQRYETAAAFGDDIDRYLNHLPVRAQRDSRAYRWRRFIVRNRVLVAATAAVVAALAVGLSIALWQARAAREEAAHSNTIKDFVLSIIQQADPMASQQTRAADLALLSAAEQRVAKELADRPQLQIQIRLAIATAYRNRGDWELARAVLRTAVSEAKEKVTADNIDLLLARIRLAEWPLLEESKQELDAMIERLRKLGKQAIPALIDGLLARIDLVGADFGGEPLLDAKEAVALAEQTFDPEHPKLLEARTVLASAFPARQPEQALAVIEPAYQRAVQSSRLEPGHPALLRAKEEYGVRLGDLGRYSESLLLLEEAVNTARMRHGSDSLELSNALGSLAWALRLKGEIKRALEAQREAYAIVAAREPQGSIRRTSYAGSLVLYLNLTRSPQEALPLIEQLLARRENGIVSEPERKRRTQQSLAMRRNLALTLLYLGEIDRARATAQALLEEDLAAYPDEVATDLRLVSQYVLVRSTQLGGHPEQVEDLVERMAQFGRRDPLKLDKIAFFWAGAEVKLALGKWTEALALADEAISLQTRTSWVPSDVSPRRARGEALLRLGRTKEASAQLEEVDRFWRDFDPEHPLAAEAAWWFAQALVAAGETARGKALLTDARPRLAASWLPYLRPLATAPAPIAPSTPTTVARE